MSDVVLPLLSVSVEKNKLEYAIKHQRWTETNNIAKQKPKIGRNQNRLCPHPNRNRDL